MKKLAQDIVEGTFGLGSGLASIVVSFNVVDNLLRTGTLLAGFITAWIVLYRVIRRHK